MMKSKDRIASKEYLAYIRTLPCAVCLWLGLKQNGPTTPSHMVSKKWSTGSDLLAVNACLTHHPQSTRAARKVLEDAGIDIDRLIENLHEDFCREEGWPRGLDFEVMMREAGYIQPPFSRRKNRN